MRTPVLIDTILQDFFENFNSFSEEVCESLNESECV